MPAPINIAGTASPLMLYGGSVTMTSTTGAAGEYNPTRLLNPNNTPMLIDQFRFIPVPTAAVEASVVRDALIRYGISISLGSIPVTRNFVTLGALTQRYMGPTAYAVTAGPFVQQDSMVTYHLPKPLYVPPGVQLNVRAQVLPGTVGAASIPLHMTIAGRSVLRSAPVPKFIDVPWVTETRCNDAVSIFVSNNNDLAAPGDGELKLVGFNGYNLVTANSGGTITAALTPLTVQMTGSNGTQIIRDPVPFQIMFPYDRGFFSCRTKLQPGEFVTAELQVNQQPSAEAQQSFCAYTAIAMHGYRKVQTPLGVRP